MLHRMDGATTRPAEAEAPPKIRVLLVDDHAVVRRGLKGFFELLDDIVIVGEAEDGAQAVQLVEQHQPDVVLCGHIHQAPFRRGGSWVDRIADTWVFNAGQQIGPVPAHVIIDTAARTASWYSLAGAEQLRLDDPGARPAPLVG